MPRRERFGSDAQNALELRFVLDPRRDLARLALDLVDMRDDQRPYVVGRRAAWLAEVIGSGAGFPEWELLGCSVNALLQAVFLQHGWPIVWPGSHSDLVIAGSVIAENGEDRVVADLRHQLEGRLAERSLGGPASQTAAE